MDLRLEVVVLPVSDVDAAPLSYRRPGWRLDADVRRDQQFRVVQGTRPGSACSIVFGRG